MLKFLIKFVDCSHKLGVNVCNSNPCVHGNCSDSMVGYKCQCSNGYIGKNCNMIGKLANIEIKFIFVYINFTMIIPSLT